MSRAVSYLLSLTLLMTLLMACGDAPSGAASVKLLLTDAPADEASELRVNFGAIRLIGAGDADETGSITLSETGGSFDVLKLRNGATALLGEATIPDGTYTQLRLIVKDATITLGGETFPIDIPSGEQSGLKINIDPSLVAASGQASVITLDFNAHRVIETGNGRYKMGPTAIRAVSVSGTVQGRIVDDDGDALVGGTIAVSDAAGPITEAVSDEDGSFKIITLTEGDFNVTVSLKGYETQTFGVSVTANEPTDIGVNGVVTLVPLAPN